MRKRRELLTADLTPLIDVVFLLLIFFLVSSVFKKDELALILNLPKTENYEEINNRNNIIIELSEAELAYKGNKLTFEELETQLVSANTSTAVVLRIDDQVPYKRVTKLFDLLQKHNLNNLMLLSEEK